MDPLQAFYKSVAAGNLDEMSKNSEIFTQSSNSLKTANPSSKITASGKSSESISAKSTSTKSSTSFTDSTENTNSDDEQLDHEEFVDYMIHTKSDKFYSKTDPGYSSDNNSTKSQSNLSILESFDVENTDRVQTMLNQSLEELRQNLASKRRDTSFENSRLIEAKRDHDFQKETRSDLIAELIEKTIPTGNVQRFSDAKFGEISQVIKDFHLDYS